MLRVGIWLAVAAAQKSILWMASLSITVASLLLLNSTADAQGRWLKSGDAFYADCTDPKNARSMFYPEPPTDPRPSFVARITVIKAISPAERESLLRGESIEGRRKVSALVHVDAVIRGHIGADEAELRPANSCIEPSYLQPGTSGFIAGQILQNDAGKRHGLWTIDAFTRVIN
jgi:hypothetical protein